ncbi:FAD-dependent oxidoreductase [Actinomadura atramentaria]|uniref:FAD-dependent oxidoreductase n=1 Tax=Actinomadura atramentaria TaxID=1990 RepID=UPI0003631801|nr:NAD(P)/FAD-dependent oxidoreductase [Actinomadura atramentaria]
MRVIVAGGGVAGAATAVALRRAGADVTVHEAYEDPAGPVGSFLSLAVNGLRALDALGCLDAVRAAGFPIPRQRMWSGGGRLLGDVPRGRPADEPMESVSLERGRLVAALRAEAVRAGARIVTGARLTDATPDGTGVRAEFSDGSADDADLLVGADGIWSRTRRLLDPAAPEPAYAGLYSVAGETAGPVAGVDPGTFNMVFCRAGAFAAIGRPDGPVWWAAQVAAPEPPDLAAVDPAALADLYRREPMPSAVLAAATETHRPTLHHVMEPVRVWRTDRIVLAGDAMHPVGAGQGASMAVEDAAALGRALLAAADVPAALAAYEADRRARTADLLNLARRNRDSKVAGPVAARVRDIVMPLVFRRFHACATAWLYEREEPRLAAVSGRAD